MLPSPPRQALEVDPVLEELGKSSAALLLLDSVELVAEEGLSKTVGTASGLSLLVFCIPNGAAILAPD